MRLRFLTSIRTKLTLVTLLLLTIPFFGYAFVAQLDQFLRAGLEQSVAGLAKAVATALHDRPALLNRKPDAPVVSLPTPAKPLNDINSTPANVFVDGAMPKPDTVAPVETVIEVRLDPKIEVDRIVRALERTDARLWVINRRGQLLALAGSLKKEAGSASSSTPSAQEKSNVLNTARTHYLKPLYQRLLGDRLLPHASDDFDDAIPADLLAGGGGIERALTGIPAVAWRTTSDDKATIITAAHPVWNGAEVVAVVVAEETTNAIRSLTTDALEQLITITLIVFVLAAGALIWIAQGLSSRIVGLRNEAETAIDARGRVESLLASSKANDELGDLSRSFSTLLERLGQYNHYLEHLAQRLSHELRTPIAVVRSSLDNLRMSTGAAPHSEAHGYITRAVEGLERLNTILKRMSEASRLEHMMRDTQKERFDLADLVRGCTRGYESAYPQARFQVQAPAQCSYLGAPDLLAQALDKLVSNAVSFSDGSAPIALELTATDKEVALTVSNAGPLLPAESAAHLFQSMVSSRVSATSGSEPHLGLGLYIVRLIAEFHGGAAFAENRAERGAATLPNGVRVGLRLPVTPL